MTVDGHVDGLDDTTAGAWWESDRAGTIALDQARAIEFEAWRRAALVRPALGGRVLRTLASALRLTTGYRKVTDRAAMPDIARPVFGRLGHEQVTGKEWEKVAADLRALRREGLIEAQAPVGRPGRVDRRRYLISLAPIARDLFPGTHPDSGSGPPTETHPESGVVSAAKRTPSRSETHPESGVVSAAKRTPSRGDTPRKGSTQETPGGGEREPRGLGRFAALVTTPPQRLDEGEIDTAYAALTADLTPGAVDAALDHLDGQRFAYPRQAADRIRQLAGTSPRRDGRTDSRLDGQQAAALAEARRNTELLQARSQEPHEPNLSLVEQAREQLRKPATRGDAA